MEPHYNELQETVKRFLKTYVRCNGVSFNEIFINGTSRWVRYIEVFILLEVRYNEVSKYLASSQPLISGQVWFCWWRQRVVWWVSPVFFSCCHNRYRCPPDQTRRHFRFRCRRRLLRPRRHHLWEPKIEAIHQGSSPRKGFQGNFQRLD